MSLLGKISINIRRLYSFLAENKHGIIFARSLIKDNLQKGAVTGGKSEKVGYYTLRGNGIIFINPSGCSRHD
jgi:hypothetical protein